MTRLELENIIQESLRDWFKKEKWVRISSSGNISGDISGNALNSV